MNTDYYKAYKKYKMKYKQGVKDNTNVGGYYRSRASRGLGPSSSTSQGSAYGTPMDRLRGSNSSSSYGRSSSRSSYGSYGSSSGYSSRRRYGGGLTNTFKKEVRD